MTDQEDWRGISVEAIVSLLESVSSGNIAEANEVLQEMKVATRNFSIDYAIRYLFENIDPQFIEPLVKAMGQLRFSKKQSSDIFDNLYMQGGLEFVSLALPHLFDIRSMKYLSTDKLELSISEITVDNLYIIYLAEGTKGIEYVATTARNSNVVVNLKALASKLWVKGESEDANYLQSINLEIPHDPSYYQVEEVQDQRRLELRTLHLDFAEGSRSNVLASISNWLQVTERHSVAIDSAYDLAAKIPSCSEDSESKFMDLWGFHRANNFEYISHRSTIFMLFRIARIHGFDVASSMLEEFLSRPTGDKPIKHWRPRALLDIAWTYSFTTTVELDFFAKALARLPINEEDVYFVRKILRLNAAGIDAKAIEEAFEGIQFIRPEKIDRAAYLNFVTRLHELAELGDLEKWQNEMDRLTKEPKLWNRRVYVTGLQLYATLGDVEKLTDYLHQIRRRQGSTNSWERMVVIKHAVDIHKYQLAQQVVIDALTNSEEITPQEVTLTIRLWPASKLEALLEFVGSLESHEIPIDSRHVTSLIEKMSYANRPELIQDLLAKTELPIADAIYGWAVLIKLIDRSGDSLSAFGMLTETLEKLNALHEMEKDKVLNVLRLQLSRIGNRLILDTLELAVSETKPSPGDVVPERRIRSMPSQFVLRDSSLPKIVKRIYNSACQVCEQILETPYGRISDAAHIQALGSPHLGPDTLENMLCLCPNHHRAFDQYGWYINDALEAVHTVTGKVIGKLLFASDHEIGLEFIRYHRFTALEKLSNRAANVQVSKN